MNRSRGITLIELIVAMVIAGIVATMVSGWIVHTARQTTASQRRDDREQEWALLRNELFQDGSRGQTLELSKTAWKLIRPVAGRDPDTIEWRIESDRLTRNQRQKLSLDTLVEGSFTPHFNGMDPERDVWSQADRNFDGLVDPEILPKLDLLNLDVVFRRAVIAPMPPSIDTLHLHAPLQGPG